MGQENIHSLNTRGWYSPAVQEEHTSFRAPRFPEERLQGTRTTKGGFVGRQRAGRGVRVTKSFDILLSDVHVYATNASS